MHRADGSAITDTSPQFTVLIFLLTYAEMPLNIEFRTLPFERGSDIRLAPILRGCTSMFLHTAFTSTVFVAPGAEHLSSSVWLSSAFSPAPGVAAFFCSCGHGRRFLRKARIAFHAQDANRHALRVVSPVLVDGLRPRLQGALDTGFWGRRTFQRPKNKRKTVPSALSRRPGTGQRWYDGRPTELPHLCEDRLFRCCLSKKMRCVSAGIRGCEGAI